MQTKRLDLVLVTALALVAASLVVAGVDVPGLRIALGLPLVLALPGYALSQAALPGRQTSGAERLLLTIGLSLAIAAAGGLLLNYTAWGLQAGSWAGLLGGVTTVSCAVAWVRRARILPLESAGRPPTSRLDKRVGVSRRVVFQATLLGLAALVSAGAYATASLAADQSPGAGFTQLWMTADRHQGPGVIRLGVRNEERAATTYRLVVQADDKIIWEQPALRLRPHETWETRMALPMGGDASRVVAALYRAPGLNSVYRRVEWHLASGAN